jgi:hypothetical protein
VPEPVALARPTRQYAVRTPSKEAAGGYHYAVLVTSRVELTSGEALAEYDGRAGMEADLKADQRGLGLAGLRKRKLAAQEVLALLIQLAHTMLVWARGWLAAAAPRLADLGIVRLMREVWAIPGRVKLAGDRVQRVRLRAEHPRARDACRGLRRLLPQSQTPSAWPKAWQLAAPRGLRGWLACPGTNLGHDHDGHASGSRRAGVAARPARPGSAVRSRSACKPGRESYDFVSTRGIMPA